VGDCVRTRRLPGTTRKARRRHFIRRATLSLEEVPPSFAAGKTPERRCGPSPSRSSVILSAQRSRWPCLCFMAVAAERSVDCCIARRGQKPRCLSDARHAELFKPRVSQRTVECPSRERVLAARRHGVSFWPWVKWRAWGVFLDRGLPHSLRPFGHCHASRGNLVRRRCWL